MPSSTRAHLSNNAASRQANVLDHGAQKLILNLASPKLSAMQMTTTADLPRSSPRDSTEPRQRNSAQCDLVLAQRKGNSRGRKEESGGSIASISSWLDQRLRNPIPQIAEGSFIRTDARKRVPPDSLAISRGAVLREAFAAAAIDAATGFGPTSRLESRSQAKEHSGHEDNGRRERAGLGDRHRDAQVHNLNVIP